jgi:hypothetical protein
MILLLSSPAFHIPYSPHLGTLTFPKMQLDLFYEREPQNYHYQNIMAASQKYTHRTHILYGYKFPHSIFPRQFYTPHTYLMQFCTTKTRASRTVCLCFLGSLAVVQKVVESGWMECKIKINGIPLYGKHQIQDAISLAACVLYYLCF